MKLGELKHGPIQAWPPMFGGSYRAGDRFPVGEVGVLRNVDIAKGVAGLRLEIEYEGRSWSGVMQWDSADPTREKLLDVLRQYIGKGLRELRDIEVD